jgi:hypothetical protein
MLKLLSKIALGCLEDILVPIIRRNHPSRIHLKGYLRR